MFYFGCKRWLLLASVLEQVLITVGTLSWVQQPANLTKAVQGKTVVLRWDYNIGDPSLKFLQVEWTQTIANNVNDVGKRVLSNNPEVFNAFKARFNITEKATLIINNVNIKDKATYRCKVSLVTGAPISSAVELIVLVPPQIILSPQNQTVNESNYAMLRCLASGKPEPTYEWTKAGAGAVVGSGANLTFKKVKRSDDGLYTCTADNGKKDLAVKAHASLIVQYLDKPNIKPQPKPGIEHVTFIINGSLSLRCTGNGNPPPQLSWIDNKGNPTNEPILRKENAGENDNGIYKCSATNPVGRKEVSVTVQAVPGLEEEYLYKIEFTLPNVTWEESLAQKDSEEYKKLSGILVPLLEILYQNRKIVILGFSSGSVKVLFQVSFEKPVDDSEALAPLLEVAKKGPLGEGLEVDPDSIKLASGSAHRTDPCKSNPCKHGSCKERDSSFTCSCDTGWQGDKCDNPVIIAVFGAGCCVFVVVSTGTVVYVHKRKGPKGLKITFKLTNVKWVIRLAQKDSEEFKNLSGKLVLLLKTLYQKRKIEILEFSSGSVKVLFQVTFKKFVPDSVALAPLLEAAKKGPLGEGLEVDPDSIKLAPGSAHCTVNDDAEGSYAKRGPQPGQEGEYAMVQTSRGACARPDGQYENVGGRSRVKNEQLPTYTAVTKFERNNEAPDQYAVVDKRNKKKKRAEGELNYAEVTGAPRQDLPPVKPRRQRQETTYADINFGKSDML